MKNKALKLAILSLLLLLPFSVLQAKGSQAGNNIYVAQDEVIAGNFYAAGETISIDGTVGGDLIVAGQNITVNGLVEGDVIAAGQNITVNGSVGGNVRIAGNSLTINGSVARNVNAFGAVVTLSPDSSVGWDVYAAASNLEARGLINGNLDGHAGQALIAGQVGKNVSLNLAKNRGDAALTLAPTAVISGNLLYTAVRPAIISERASIGGVTEQQVPAVRNVNWVAAWLWSKLFAMFAALIVGLALVFGLKGHTVKALDKLEKDPVKAILPGLVVMLVVPPIAFILALTLIGIPLALILLALWLVASYLAKIVAALWLGRWISARVAKQELSLVWTLVIGVVVIWLLAAVPFVGWLICLAATGIGLGAIWNYAYGESRNI